MRLIAFAVTGLILAGCGGTLFPGAGTMDIALQSTPPGADAITSLGPSCRTPCTVAVPSPTEDFSVSFALTGFQPMTVPVRITRSVGGRFAPPFTSLNPDPVVAQLEPVAPPPRRVKKKKMVAQ
ncbi:hypothetical protein [Bradyrhizobium sp.]|uniref:hypothetical protein n=1 Tax=Bradyrhizobium sp. TaxID=376 RepID=UPI002D4F0EF2|nr:hypothetical protein [Bradyrhizobium sp.]HZR72650.1 hypothetical protein [Bradyrhizobium sp.]